MNNKSDEQFIITQALIESNKQEMKSTKQDSDEKRTQFTVKYETMLAVISNQLNTLTFSPTHKDTPTPPDTTNVVLANRRAPPLEGGNYTKIGGMWILKYEISSPKFYGLLIKTEIKVDNALDIKNFYNHIKMCLNPAIRLQEDLLPPFIFLECLDIHLLWTLNISGND